MLLLDDGTHFTTHTIAATKTAKVSRAIRVDWMRRVHLPVQWHTQVFLDSVVQRIMARRFLRQRPVQLPMMRQQIVRQQRSFLEAISSQLSALPPPAVRQMVSLPENG